jgi:hypothetical protein
VENSASTGSWVTQGSGGGEETGRRKRCCLKQEASSVVVPEGYYQDTKTSVVEAMSKRVGRKERGGGLGLLV